MKLYSQCMLESKGRSQVAWIEKKFAEKGLLVTLENEGEDIWRVKEVYEKSSMSSKELTQNRKARMDFASKLK